MNPQTTATEIKAVEGEQFEIELESYPGSGAIWYHVPSEKQEAKLLEQKTIPDRSSIGGAAIQHFVFKSVVPGLHHIKFELRRAWEDQGRRSYEAVVDVEPKK